MHGFAARYGETLEAMYPHVSDDGAAAARQLRRRRRQRQANGGGADAEDDSAEEDGEEGGSGVSVACASRTVRRAWRRYIAAPAIAGWLMLRHDGSTATAVTASLCIALSLVGDVSSLHKSCAIALATVVVRVALARLAIRLAPRSVPPPVA